MQSSLGTQAQRISSPRLLAEWTDNLGTHKPMVSARKILDRLPLEMLKRYEKWKDIVRISGPAGLRLIKGFHDERLYGEWQGHRSSRLNAQYRVIYKVEDQRVLVIVMDVTAHDYRRP